MDRQEALERLKRLEGQNLHDLARKFKITVEKNGKYNKGWAGHVFERYLGLPLNSSRNPNFGSWELKSIPLKYKKNGSLGFKETMAITMIDPINVAQTQFSDSHLLLKLKKAIVVARTVGKNFKEPTFVHSVVTLDLKGDLYEAVEEDYNMIRYILRPDPVAGFKKLTGAMGIYIQPRTKGSGHGSTSRAFYASPRF